MLLTYQHDQGADKGHDDDEVSVALVIKNMNQLKTSHKS